MRRVRCASPTLHVFLLLNYDMDTDMYAGFITIEKRSRLPGSISTRKSLNELERDMG